MGGRLIALGVSGSYRRDGNSEHLLKIVLDTIRKSGLDVKLIRLAGLNIKPCVECWKCLDEHMHHTGECAIKDDMTPLYEDLLRADAIVLSTPVFFNNVSSIMKAFIDRTWCLLGRLHDKIGGAIVVGNRYGHEAALAALVSFFLKHRIIVAFRGVVGYAFRMGEVEKDEEAIRWSKALGNRIVELLKLTHKAIKVE